MTARAPKRARTKRSPKHGRIALTERDLDLLTLTGLCRYVSTDQLGREFFPSADRARRRTRALFDAGLIHVAVIGALPNLVSLTREGLAAVTDARPSLGPRLGRAGAIRVAGVGHHLAVVDMRLYAAALGAHRHAPLMRWSNASSDRLADFGFRDHRLVPDGLAEFLADRQPVAVAIEVDLGTEALSVLAGKWKRYQGVASDGRVDALWVYAAAGPGRIESIRRQLVEHRLTAWARLLDAALVRARPVRELPSRAEGPKETDSASWERERGSGIGDR